MCTHVDMYANVWTNVGLGMGSAAPKGTGTIVRHMALMHVSTHVDTVRLV